MTDDNNQPDFFTSELRTAALGRRQLLPGAIGLTSVAVVLIFLKLYFVAPATSPAFAIWHGVMTAITISYFILTGIGAAVQPGDRDLVRVFLPLTRLLTTALNLAVIASPWVLLPDADPGLRAVILMLYLWFMATEVMATVEPHSQIWLALLGVPSSVSLFLHMEAARYALPLSLLMAVAGLSLLAIHRTMRRAAEQSLDMVAAIRPVPALIGTATPFITPALPPEPTNEPAALTVETGLTPRQAEVLRHLSEGLSNKQIAQALGISPATVKTHVAQTLSAMGAANRTDAAMKARSMGIV